MTRRVIMVLILLAGWIAGHAGVERNYRNSTYQAISNYRMLNGKAWPIKRKQCWNAFLRSGLPMLESPFGKIRVV
jgi:hypothetical protein